MIQSKFINDILDLLFHTDKDGMAVRNQLLFLSERSYDYTEAGLFVWFTTTEMPESFRLTSDITIIGGVDIKSSMLEIGASATAFIRDGIIDYLEIWSYSSDYPKKELPDYF